MALGVSSRVVKHCGDMRLREYLVEARRKAGFDPGREALEKLVE